MMRRFCLSFAVTASIATALAPAARAEDFGEVTVIRNWLAACDNVRTCRALSLPDEGADDRWFIRLDRDGEGGAPVKLMLATAEENGRREGPLELRSGAETIVTLTPGQGYVVQDDGLIIQNREAIEAIIAALRRVPSLELHFATPPADGKARPTISLDGASAALLWIDDRQKRIGTVTALVRRGDKPASAVPAPPRMPPALPELTGNAAPPTSVTPAARREMERQSAGYCDRDQTLPSNEPTFIARLGRDLLLASVPCASGAYNFSRAYFLLQDGPRPQVRPANFPRPYRLGRDETGEEPSNVLINGDTDDRQGGVSYYSKGRGLGDCGDTGSWQWDGQAFRPVAAMRMPTCRGIGADHWPELYRRREANR